MDGEEIRRFIGRIILYAFGAFLFFTYAHRNIPSGSFSEMGNFLFTFFFNFCTQWAIYKLQALGGAGVQIGLIIMQLVFFGWSIQSSMFLYRPHYNDEYASFFFTPLQQFGVIIPVFLVLLIAHTIRNR
jgi:hypothetical protein